MIVVLPSGIEAPSLNVKFLKLAEFDPYGNIANGQYLFGEFKKKKNYGLLYREGICYVNCYNGYPNIVSNKSVYGELFVTQYSRDGREWIEIKITENSIIMDFAEWTRTRLKSYKFF